MRAVLLEKRIRGTLPTDGRRWPVAWIDLGLVTEREQHLLDGRDEGLVVATRQVRASNRACEQGVPNEQVVSSLPFRADLQAHPARTVARRVMRPDFEVPHRDHLPWGVVLVHWGRGLDAQPEQQPVLHRVSIEELIVAVEIHCDAEGPFGRRHAGHVIDVRVREEDVPNRELMTHGECEQPINLGSRVDEDRFARPLTPEDETVLHERANRLRFDLQYRSRHERDHHRGSSMIVAVLDDLMFASKIRSAATAAGVTIVFARSRDAALDAVREHRPSLVILDLNNPRTDPLGLVEALKSLDGDVASPPIATLGYVSHVDTATIDAARVAGVDTVVARSAFTQRIGELIQGR